MPFYLFEEITEETSKRFFEEVSKVDFDNRIIINSGGGNTHDTFAIVDYMKSFMTSRFETICAGRAYSGALLILSTGGNRKAYKHSTFLLHQPRHPELSGSVNEITNDLLGLENDYDVYCEILAENTGKTALEIKNLIDSAPCNEITLNAKQALKFGLIDEIIGG